MTKVVLATARAARLAVGGARIRAAGQVAVVPGTTPASSAERGRVA